MAFPENLIYYRKRANMSQEKLAERLNITRQAISKWEAGTSAPDVNMLQSLSDALGVTPNQLIAGEPEQAEGKKEQGNTDNLIFSFSAIFMMLIFLGGIALMIFNLFIGEVYEPFYELVAYVMMLSSVIAFAVLVRRKRRKSGEK